jgi:uncharacterized protein (TIGR03083 family)
MSPLAERTVSALRSNHDHLVEVVSGLSEEVLVSQSGAADWPVAQVLSHLGSGAEIAAATVTAARAGEAAPGSEFNQGVWDRWNALGPEEQASGFIEHNAVLVAILESLSAQERDTTMVDLGFTPQPLPLVSYLGMRLNEAAMHGWDVDVAVDPAAEVSDDAAGALAEHFVEGLGFLLAFTTKPANLSERAVVDLAGSPYVLVIDEAVQVSTDGPQPTATFTGSLGAALRLLSGRLKPGYTADDVQVSGNVDLDDLRQVFPGY